MNQKKPTVLAYYFPNWHVDPRNEQWHGPGWTEWEVLKYARPRFEGHRMPRVPLWGYLDESDPAVMALKIDAAVSHGVDGFVFDYYWYPDGGYRLGCLDKGFLAAENCEKAKFAVMWCNHDPVAVHPQAKATGSFPLGPSEITVQTFYEATEHCIRHYFCRPNYLRNSQGKLYFCIYLCTKMIRNFGGEDGMRIVLEDFRRRVAAAGLGELDLCAIADFDDELFTDPDAFRARLHRLGIDSLSSHGLPRGIVHDRPFPHLPYREVMRCSLERYRAVTALAGDLSYNIHLYQGYDNSARAVPSDVYGLYGGWFTWIVSDNTPELFAQHCRDAKDFFDRSATGEYITVHSWNEWTEGAYLEPDTDTGYAYLDAIRRVFREEG